MQAKWCIQRLDANAGLNWSIEGTALNVVSPTSFKFLKISINSNRRRRSAALSRYLLPFLSAQFDLASLHPSIQYRLPEEATEIVDL
jgi:P pilus assembly chaperone PapD